MKWIMVQHFFQKVIFHKAFVLEHFFLGNSLESQAILPWVAAAFTPSSLPAFQFLS